MRHAAPVTGERVSTAAGLNVRALSDGHQIPLLARIAHVADSFEAMTSDRPYRKAPDHEFAIGELHRCSGTQFDPRVVAALCRTLEEPTEPDTDEQPPSDREPLLSVA